MIDTLIIDTLIKLAEKLMELLKQRKELQAEHFAKYIDPIFRDLNTVHQNYLEIFTNCATELRDEADLAKIARAFLADRLEQEALRRSISALAESLAHNKELKPFQLFFLEISNYFYNNPFPKDTRSTALLNEIERCVREQKREELISAEFSTIEMRQFLSQHVENTLAGIRSSWAKLSHLYAKALSEEVK